MRELAVIAAAVSLFLFTPALCQQTPAPAWINVVISAPVASSEKTASFIERSTAGFLNDACQPSDLDGIQVLSVQTGHNEVFHLHVFCRQDKAASTRYKVTMLSVPNHLVDQTAKAVLGKPKIRLGPLYLGATGEPDAILLIEKMQ